MGLCPELWLRWLCGTMVLGPSSVCRCLDARMNLNMSTMSSSWIMVARVIMVTMVTRVTRMTRMMRMTRLTSVTVSVSAEDEL